MSDFSKLRFLTTRRDKIALFILLGMTILSSIIETVGVGIIMPFITFASNPSLLLENQYGSMIYHFFDFSSTQTFMFAFSGALIIFYFFRLIYNTFYSYSINRFAFRKYHNLAFRLFQKILHSSYLDFTNKNTDELRREIVTDALSASNYIRNFLSLYSEIFTISFLYVILLIVSWKMTLVLTCILSLKIVLITQTISRFLKKRNDKKVVIEKRFLSILSNSFGNYKIIKIKDAYQALEYDFLHRGDERAKIEIENQTFLEMPRNLLETFGFAILISCVAYILYRYEDASAVLPIMSMYALALYKILPSTNKILTFFNWMKIYSKSLEVVYNELKDIPSAEGSEKIGFNRAISLCNISFSYIVDKPIIQNFSLEIKKGEKIAFVGPSGSGKSTLVDIITGFYQPNSGEIFVDNEQLTQENIKSWRKKIGYIPQQIYLFDGDVAENVAFGSEYDEEKIVQACKIAKIYDFLQDHEGIHTKVGDGGIKLSGGQRQRIGIARAIYDNPEILVLDEATSALDNDTEAQIMDEIYELSKDKTLLVIAHRLSTVERCNRKIELK